MSVLTFKNEAEVLQYYKKDTEGNQVIIFENVVYEVGDFMHTHPGGAKLIEDMLGKPIDEEYEDAEHTPSATRALKDLKVIG